MDIFHNLFYVPIFNLLMFLYQLFAQNLGLAIIGVALVAKLVTLPLSRMQIKSAEKNREFQSRTNEIKKKFKNDKEKLSQELARLQAEYLPGQLGGCLNLIIIIVLLIQVRNVVVNLVNQGVHAFNQVAYSESVKLPEDSVAFRLPEGFAYGLHELKYKVTASNGVSIDKTIRFGIAENEEQKNSLIEELQKEENELSDEARAARDEQLLKDRQAGIEVFIEELHAAKVIVGRDREIKAYLRPPSRETIDESKTEVYLDGKKLESELLSITQGGSLNFDFLGADLSKVATDIGFNNIGAVAPYVLIAVGVGITQLFASRIQTGLTAAPAEPKNKDEKVKDKNKKDEEPDFAQMMQQSSKQMMFIFPLLTVAMSLGFLGGGAIFPTGVSLFWTGQNGFVIIEQLIANRKSVFLKLKSLLFEHERSN